MLRKVMAMAACAAALASLSGCLGSFAANQARRQGARSADHYLKKYAEPEIRELYPEDSQTQAKRDVRQARSDLADTIVRAGNNRQKTRVGVDDAGWLTNER